ncbi:MAG TPA: SDR family NAD(P)-dependent oxidoreductase, partial [Mycobacterium sp.]|nr:SDR family NAD(P)-dependent oxidoreductase [Mycobacterium sp.]
DTACSSSLVAIHLACKSLRTGESDLALAAGVNLVLSPAVTRGFDAAGAMSQSGACRAFDAGADGFVRGEGCGVVVLKRLCEALRDGNRVWAVVRGSAINQDGRSNGLMAPNPAAQAAVLRAACADAGVEPREVDYVEAHGTGTLLGDPIEARGLGSVYGRGRAPDSPLLIGSVKTNVGHLEAAAGVTGFIKATLAVQRGRIPANLHFDTPNPHIPFEELGLKVVDEPTNWPSTGRPRRAAVSSFGFGGTNAHLVLEQPPAPASQRLHPSGAPVSTLVVSGKTPRRVARWAGALAEWMDGAGAVVPLADIAHTLNHHRSRQGSFATVAARTREQAVAGLRALAAGQSALGVVAPQEGSIGPGTVFVYSGRGSQWAGMGRQLFADEPAFAEAIAKLEPDFVAQAGFSLHHVIADGKELVGIEQIQLGLIGTQLALTELWRSYGVQPDVVIGHSMGEVAAAVVAGALTPVEGLRVTATRARLMAPLSGQGAMALLEFDAAATEALIADYPSVTLGIYASPRQTVISGPPQLIDTLIDKVRQQNCFASRVSIEVAPHNPAMDALQPQMRSELADLTPRPPTIPIISTTYTDLNRRPTFDAEHWAANLRNPVRFQQAIAHAFSGRGGSHHTFIEISAHPLLTHSISDTLKGTYGSPNNGASYLSIGTLQRDADDTLTFHTNLNTAHTTLPPQTPHPPEPHPVLPTAPWQHTHHWITTTPALKRRGRNGVAVNPTGIGNTELDGWSYRLEWPVLPLPSGPRAAVARSGSWLVVSDQGLSEELARVADPGSLVEFLAPPALDDDATRLHGLLDGVDNVLYAPPVAAGPVDVESAYHMFHAARRLAAAMIATDSRPKLIVLTRNAQPVTEGERANPAHAVLWGLVRTLALEHPEIWGGVIDLDESIPPELAARYVLDEAAGIDGEDQVVYRSGVRRAPRLERRTAPAASVTLSENTSQLVIGATGNIGPHLIRQLAEMGATTIVAVSRNPGARLAELAESLDATGTNLIPVAADATDPAAMTALFDRFGVDLPPLEGIYLAAFAGQPVLLVDMTDDDVAAMFRPKLDAARLLHRLSLKQPVKHFVSFSSISGLIGSRWLAHYTATSAFLDTLGYARRLMGLPATVVAWGLWKSLADAQQDASQVSAESGLQPMADEVAIGALPLAMSPDAGVHSVVVAADWPLLAAAYRTRGALRIVDDLLPAPGDAPMPESTNRLFALEWEPAPLDKTADTPGGLLLIGDPDVDDPLLPALQSSLRDRLAEVELVTAGDEAKLRAAITGIGWDGIVVVCPPRGVDESLSDQAQLELAQARTLLIASVVETVKRMGARISPRLWIVTRGAQQVDPTESVTLAQAELRGIARVLTFEHSELKATLLDIDPEGTGSLAALTEELLAGSDQDEVAYRDGQRYVNRLVPAPTTAKGDLAAESRHTVANLDGAGAVRLQIDQPGRLDALTVHQVKRIRPQGDQVEVRVAAAGLNFSDVLKAMGVYPGLDGAAPVIGGECVGYVTAVGDEVDSVEVGQRVIAFGPGTFGTHLTTIAELVVPIPDALPDNQAATFGVAYLTAWHSLCEVGRLSAGERVLIHSATGGVGMAAVSIAQMIGARIYTTAGSDAKREILSGLGVEYMGDSRRVDFADDILELTDGYGVDVILNSLPGEAIQRGMQILARGGRFIELGKKDVYADANLGLAALAKSASFSVIDLDLNLKLQPARYRQLLQHILQHVSDGKLQMLPVTEFSLHDATDAFRLMASRRHTGKIVISIPDSGSIEVAASPPPQPLVSHDGGYLIVGGMGGLGFVVARWLAEHGAGFIVLNGRSAPSDDVAAAIADLNAAGHRIEVVTGDIAEPGTADRLVQAVEAAGFRLAGVLHSAMVLADEIVLNMTDSGARRVFAPKVTGSWRLHRATAGRDVDWWLTFSSAAALLGAPGQGAHAAADSWVEGLVAHRRSTGLPAVGINWGPWAEVGRAQFFADHGVALITAEEGLAAMQTVLAADRARTGVFSLDARQWFQSFPAVAGSSLFAKLHVTLERRGAVERRGGAAIRAQLDALDAIERPGCLASAIADEIRDVLRSSDPIDHDRPLQTLGLDSLMGLELRNRLEARLGITLPAGLVWAYPTITDLAGALCERMDYALPADDQTSDAKAELSVEEMDLLSDLVEASELETATKGES